MDVVVLDDLSTGHLENIAPFLNDLEFIRGDIRDRDLVSKAARKADLVFHQAALVSVPESVEKPRLSAEINDLGTLNVFEASRSAGVRRVVYASSSAIYGGIIQMPHHEGMTPRPNTPYGAHKLLGEHYASMFLELYGLEVVALRYFNVYGPRQDPTSPYSGVISIFLDRISQGQRPTVFGDGEQSRDFVHIQDIVTANFLAGEVPGAEGRAFNLGTGHAVSLNEMLELLSQLTGIAADPVYEPARAGDIRESRADVSLARQILGFEASLNFKEGLAWTLSWVKEQACFPREVVI